MAFNELDRTGDLAIAAVSYLVCIFLLYKSYQAAGPAWRRLYSVDIELLGRNYHLSGIYAGSILCTLFFGSYMVSSLVSPLSYGVLNARTFLLLPFVYVLLVFFCTWHAEAKIQQNSIDQMDYKLLKGAYLFYNFYAAAVWFVALLGAIKVYLQFYLDIGQHQVLIRQFADFTDARQLSWATTFNTQTMVDVELAKIKYDTLFRSLIKQVEPITFYAIYWIIIGLVTKLTRIGKVVEGTAKQVGYYVAPIFIGFLLLASIVIYFIQYRALSSEAMQLYDAALDMHHATADHIQRIADLRNPILRYSGMSGFIRMFADEGGFYVISLAAVQSFFVKVLR